MADLASMAVAQVWKGTSALPNVSEMEAQTDGHYAWLVRQLQKGTMASDVFQEESWLRTMNDLAGTGCSEKLGFGIQGWKWWVSEPAFANLVMAGVENPSALRIFDGKRKKWEGAREAIEEVDRQVGELRIGKKND